MPSRNPDWNRDELILALDAYKRWDGYPPAKKSPEIAALSETMGQLALALGRAPTGTYRNTNGVYMKLMNFRRFDLTFIDKGRVGLSRGNQLEEVVWSELAHQPAHLARVAKAILAALDSRASESGVIDASITPGEEEAIEGRMLTISHRRRERSAVLVAKKKADVLQRLGRLFCEVCGFDYAQRYGDGGSA